MASLTTVCCALGATPAAAETGDLIQQPGLLGCVAPFNAECSVGHAFYFVRGVAASADGKSVYATGTALAIFDRAPGTGALVQKEGAAGCFTGDGSSDDVPNACRVGTGLGSPQTVAVSPDSKNVYVGGNGVEVFDRNTATGDLTQQPGTAGCITAGGQSTEDPATAGQCTPGTGVGGVSGVTVSPDGRNVYATNGGDGTVATFDRNSTTGSLTQKQGSAAAVGGIATAGARGLTVSEDGKNLYVASEVSDAVAIFDRDPATGTLTQKPAPAGCVSETGHDGQCANGVALDTPRSVAVSRDGRSVYSTSIFGNAIAIFDRDPATGELTQKPAPTGCFSPTGQSDPGDPTTAGGCSASVGLEGPGAITVSPDNENVYVGNQLGNSVTWFNRDPTTRELDFSGCISESSSGGACGDGRGLRGVFAVAVSLDGRNVYSGSNFGHAVGIFDREDTSPPQTTITSGPAQGSSSGDTRPTFGFRSSEPLSTFQCSVDGGPFGSCSSPFTTSSLSVGSHRFAVRAVDPSGNTDPTPAVRTFTVIAPVEPAGPAVQGLLFADCPTLTANVIRGTAASNSIIGTSRADRIFAGIGNDAVDGLAGNDCIDLGSGTDRGLGRSGNDLIVGGLGRDRLGGGSGNDRLRGGSLGDRLFGDSGNDRLHGQSGSDRVSGGRGRDRISGGSGNDVVSAGSSKDRATGGRGNDRISGNSGNDSLLGNSGRDRLNGGSGRDRISGGSGNDKISARDGKKDRINCGSGRDRVTADRIDAVARNCERVVRRR